MSSKRFFKKANIKKKNKNSNQSPRNSRSITDPFKLSVPKITSQGLLSFYRGSLKIFIAAIFLLTSVIVGLDLYDNIKTKKEIDHQRSKLTQELEFWRSFIEKNENYRDAYLEASTLEYKLGNTSSARKYVKKVLDLDPNSENGKKLEEFLVSR